MVKFPGYPEALTLALEETPGGEVVGRDPRKMTPAELQAFGHVKSPLLKIIRAKCLDCSHSDSEVRKCTCIKTCALWPYRMRTNPFSERTGNPDSAKALIEWRKRQDEGTDDDE